MKNPVLFHFALPNTLAAAGLLWSMLLAGLGSAAAQSVTGLRLINADTDQPMYLLGTGSASNYINYATLPTQRLNVEATTTGPVGSVVFKLDGNVFRIENAAPYALAGDNGTDYYPWTPSLGSHNLTATAYPQANGQGTAGNTLLAYLIVTDVAPPADLTTTVISGSRVNLSWTDRSNNEAYFTIERQTSPLPEWRPVGYAAANASGYADTTVTPGTFVAYRVYAVKNAATASPYSNVAYGAPLPPTGLVAKAITSTSIELSWTPAQRANDYRVEMSVNDTNHFQYYDATYPISRITYGELAPNTTYYFRMQTAYEGKLSPYSQIARVTTYASHIDDKFIVINANTGQPIDSFYHDTYTIDFAALGTQNLSIVVKPVPQTVGSVVFALNGSIYRIENTAPYALAGDAGGNYYPWTPAVGTHTLRVTPYAQPNGQGVAGAARTVTLHVVGSGAGRLGLPESAAAPAGVVRAYPIPARDKVTVDFAGHSGGPRSVAITDGRGSLLYRGTFGSNLRRVDINLASLPMAPGLYLLNVQSPTTHQVIKLIKE